MPLNRQKNLVSECSFKRLPTSFEWLPSDFKWSPRDFEWQSSILEGCRALWALPSVFVWLPSVLRMTVKQFRVIAEDMQRCLCLVRTICSRSVQKALADNFSFCIWAAFACARLKSVPETRVDGFSKFFCRKRFGCREKFDCRQVRPCGI